MRGEPSVEELMESARGICSGNSGDDYALKLLDLLFEPLAKAYLNITRRKVQYNGVQKEFFGLRDFYR